MNIWSVVMASAAVLIFVAFLVLAQVTYKPHRARNVKYAEQIVTPPLVQEYIVAARLAHPEIVRTTRLDWHPYFLMPHVGVFGYAWCVFSGAKLTNNVAALGATTRFTMATCFLVGSSIVLTGALMGSRVGRFRIMPSVRNHMTSTVLGHDIVLPYRLSVAGQFAVAVSMGIYSFTSFNTTTGSLGGWLTAVLAAACVFLAPLMLVHARRFEKWDSTLISDARERLGIGETDAN